MLASTVSSKMLRAIGNKEGFHFIETLTGFKWMGKKLLQSKISCAFAHLSHFCCRQSNGGTISRKQNGFVCIRGGNRFYVCTNRLG